MGNKNNLLMILLLCFIIIFIVVIFAVNSWLKQALKEETVSDKQVVAPIVYTETKYVQKPIEIVPAQQALQPAVRKKAAITAEEPVAGATRQRDSAVPPPTRKVLIN